MAWFYPIFFGEGGLKTSFVEISVLFNCTSFFGYASLYCLGMSLFELNKDVIPLFKTKGCEVEWI